MLTSALAVSSKKGGSEKLGSNDRLHQLHSRKYRRVADGHREVAEGDTEVDGPLRGVVDHLRDGHDRNVRPAVILRSRLVGCVEAVHGADDELPPISDAVAFNLACGVADGREFIIRAMHSLDAPDQSGPKDYRGAHIAIVAITQVVDDPSEGAVNLCVALGNLTVSVRNASVLSP